MTDTAYFIEKNGLRYAGVHLLIDLWGAAHLDDIDVVREALLSAVAACGATLRDLDLHKFNEGGGIAGIAMLMQSHISIHSWPEVGYGAFDVFVCGEIDPYKIVPVLQEVFEPEEIQISEHKRGLRVARIHKGDKNRRAPASVGLA